MLEVDDLLQQLKEYDSLVLELQDFFEIDKARDEVANYEMLMLSEDFWQDVDESQKTMAKVKVLKSQIDKYEQITTLYDDAKTMCEIAKEEDDASLIKECKSLVSTFKKQYDDIMLEKLYKGEYDKNTALVAIHAGAGGTESCDWVAMMLRMYTRYAEKNGYKVSIINYVDGEEAGIKSVTIEVEGLYAYGNFKSEKGVHRLIRISPFDTSGRRHTSFASVDVLPLIEDEIDVDINTEDLKIDTYRASGAGGQHINTTDSAIRITHIPTGIVVQCQNQRSQHKNKEMAMKMLQSKIKDTKDKETRENLDSIRGEVMSNGFGSQIRSYVFHPYNMVKDHRTNVETGNVNAVLDGNIDEFVNGYLKMLSVE